MNAIGKRGGALVEAVEDAASVSSDSAILGSALSSPPKVVIPFGRGGKGKSVICRWTAERARNQGRSVLVADADPTNRTLSVFFPDVLSPKSTLPESVRLWLDGILEDRMAKLDASLLLDFGATGDEPLRRLAAELPIVEALEETGCAVVAVHMLGTHVQDLSVLAALEGEGLFAPQRTLLVFNEGLVQVGVPSADAFSKVIRHPLVDACVKRGAKTVIMPALSAVLMQRIDERKGSFIQAGEGGAPEGYDPFGPLDRRRVNVWWGQMEEAFAEVAEEYLP